MTTERIRKAVNAILNGTTEEADAAVADLSTPDTDDDKAT